MSSCGSGISHSAQDSLQNPSGPVCSTSVVWPARADTGYASPKPPAFIFTEGSSPTAMVLGVKTDDTAEHYDL